MTIRINLFDHNMHATRALVVTDIEKPRELFTGERFIEVRYIQDETDSAMPTDTERISAIEDSLVSITTTITSINTQLRDHRRYVNTEIRPGVIDQLRRAIAAVRDTTKTHATVIGGINAAIQKAYE